MAKQMYLEFPLKPEHVEEFCALCNSKLGFELTKKQPGFISAEWMISTSDDGSKRMHLWEKWDSEEHFHAFMETPERAKDSEFDLLLRKWGAGETKVFWGLGNSA